MTGLDRAPARATTTTKDHRRTDDLREYLFAAARSGDMPACADIQAMIPDVSNMTYQRKDQTLLDYRETRHNIQTTFAYALPSREVINRLAAAGPLLEVGAGKGFWSYMIERAGGNIIATDNKAWFGGREVLTEWKDVTRLEGTTAIREHPERDVLMVWPRLWRHVDGYSSRVNQLMEEERSSPEYGYMYTRDEMAPDGLKSEADLRALHEKFIGDYGLMGPYEDLARQLQAMQPGRTLYYVGEHPMATSSPITADPLFFDWLEVAFDLQETHPVPNWPDVHDKLYVFRKK